MNFYFCEGCGKRITDSDLGQGRARDKQLKGMYCVTCAQGVNTMEMLPVTGVKLRDDDPISTPVPSAGAKDAAQPRNAVTKSRSQPANSMMFGIAAGAIFVIVVAMFLISSGEKPRPAQSTPPMPVRADESASKQAAIPVVTPLVAVSPEKIDTSDKDKQPSSEKAPATESPEADIVANMPQVSPPPAPVEEKPEQTPPPSQTNDQTPAPIPAPKPAHASISYAKFEELALGSQRLEEIHTAAKTALDTVEPADKTHCTLLINCIEQASSVEKAVQTSLLQKKGTRIVLTRSDGTRKLTDITDDGTGGLTDHAEDPAIVHLQEFTRDQLKDADSCIAAFEALRGDPELAKKLVTSLDAAQRGALEKIIEVRLARLHELKAADEIKKFNDLMAKNNHTLALSLALQIQKNYAGCKALTELNPPWKHKSPRFKAARWNSAMSSCATLNDSPTAGSS